MPGRRGKVSNRLIGFVSVFVGRAMFALCALFGEYFNNNHQYRWLATCLIKRASVDTGRTLTALIILL